MVALQVVIHRYRSCAIHRIVGSVTGWRKRNVQNHPKQHSGEANKRVGVLMLHRVIAVVFSDVSARVIGLCGTSPRPQRPQSTGSPARHLLLPVPFLLSLTLPLPSHLLLGLFYFPIALLFSKYATQSTDSHEGFSSSLVSHPSSSNTSSSRRAFLSLGDGLFHRVGSISTVQLEIWT